MSPFSLALFTTWKALNGFTLLSKIIEVHSQPPKGNTAIDLLCPQHWNYNLIEGVSNQQVQTRPMTHAGRKRRTRIKRYQSHKSIFGVDLGLVHC